MTRYMMIAFAILLLFTGGLTTHAQEDDIPFPPDPSEIFAEGIEAEIVSSPALQQAQQPISNISYDDRARILTVHNSSYSYPQEISQILYYNIDENNPQLYLLVANELVDETRSRRTWIWYFDAETETFSRYESLCPLQFASSPNQIRQAWVIVADETGQSLCEMATGNRINLSSDYYWRESDNFRSTPDISPDGEWLVLFAWNSETSGEISVFSYEIATEEFRLLGGFPSQDRFGVNQWLDDTIIIGAGNTPEWSMRNLYIADVTRNDNLEWATGRLRFGADYYDDPPRFEFVSGMIEGGIPCVWVIYDIATRQTTTYDLDYLCSPIIGKLGETAYHLNVPDIYDDATLVRFNAITGERVDLYSGEIEDVLNVSEDGRYATLILDNSGRIDLPNSVPFDLQGAPIEPHLAYVDLVTDEILFEFPVGWHSWYGQNSTEPRGELRPLGDDTFIALSNTVVDNPSTFPFSTANLIVQENGVYVEEFLVDNAIQILDNQHILIAPQGSLSEGIEIFDIETRTSQPFIRPFDDSRYAISFSRYNTSRVIVSLGTYYDAPRAIYEVDFPYN